MDKYAPLHKFISKLRKHLGHNNNLTNIELGEIAQMYGLDAVLVSKSGHYLAYAGALHDTKTGNIEKHIAYDPYSAKLVEISPDSELLVFGKYVDQLIESDPLNAEKYVNISAAKLPVPITANEFHSRVPTYNFIDDLEDVKIYQKRNDCGLYSLFISHFAEKL